ncbi:MAG: hypothetical protein HY322_01850 [Betaproteobacteria bacterium]|nr:hypothetical protein [Betaproteobacteria bacterium]
MANLAKMGATIASATGAARSAMNPETAGQRQVGMPGPTRGTGRRVKLLLDENLSARLVELLAADFPDSWCYIEGASSWSRSVKSDDV